MIFLTSGCYNKSIVKNICFYNELNIGNLVSKNRHGGECLLEKVESIMAEIVKLPKDILLDEISYQDDNI